MGREADRGVYVPPQTERTAADDTAVPGAARGTERAWSMGEPSGRSGGGARAATRAAWPVITPGTRTAADPAGGGRLPVAGMIVTLAAAVWTAVFVTVFGMAMAAVSPWLSAAVNVVAAAGIVPVLRRHRRTPAIRWGLWGVWPGIILGWAALAVAAL